MNRPEKIETHLSLHSLEEKQLTPLGKQEYILTHLKALPKDFLDMTLLDIEGDDSVYVFSRIEVITIEEKIVKGAVYRKL